jgi:recombinational DNA repair protein RecR
MYAPNFSEFTAVSVRRLAWALKTNMGKAVERMTQLLPVEFDNGYVCSHCRDRSKCDVCAFSKSITESEHAAIVTM